MTVSNEIGNRASVVLVILAAVVLVWYGYGRWERSRVAERNELAAMPLMEQYLRSQDPEVRSKVIKVPLAPSQQPYRREFMIGELAKLTVVDQNGVAVPAHWLEGCLNLRIREGNKNYRKLDPDGSITFNGFRENFTVLEGVSALNPPVPLYVVFDLYKVKVSFGLPGGPFGKRTLDSILPKR